MTIGGERWLLLLLLSLGWGSAYLFQDEAVAELPPLTMTAVRLAASAALLWAALRLKGQSLPREGTAWCFFAAIGIVGNLLPFALTSWAQTDVDSSVAGILSATVPLITLVLASFLLAHERMTPGRLGGFALGFAGVLLLLGPEAGAQAALDEGRLPAYGALLASAFCYALSAVAAGRMPAMPPLAAATGVLLAAAVATAPLALLFEDWPAAAPTLDALGSLAVLALIVTPWATLAYFRLVTIAGPAFLSQFNYFNPLVAVACGALVLGERVDSTAFWALALILAGVAAADMHRSPARAEAPAPGDGTAAPPGRFHRRNDGGGRP